MTARLVGLYPVSAFPLRTPSLTRSGGLKRNLPKKEPPKCEFRSFHAALKFHMARNGDTNSALRNALAKRGVRMPLKTLVGWRQGSHVPRYAKSLKALRAIERLYKLEAGFFARYLTTFSPSFKRRTRWHLNEFHTELNYQMQLHGDTSETLAKAIRRNGECSKSHIIGQWKIGRCTPRARSNIKCLAQIEKRYKLTPGHFLRLISKPETATKRALTLVRPSLRSLFYWHLPADFEERTAENQNEIVSWIFNNIFGGATEFGRSQQRNAGQQFAIRFPQHQKAGRSGKVGRRRKKHKNERIADRRGIRAPGTLASEMRDLVEFKTSILPPLGFRRSLRWGSHTAEKSVRDFSLFFGALHASPASDVGGLGIPLNDLTFGLLAIPSVWDWYLHWREKRRGFFTTSDKSILYSGKSILRRRTGWIRQHPELAKKLVPVAGVLARFEISRIKADWATACDDAMDYILDRVPELQRTARIHRDTTEAIVPVLQSKNPVRTYRRIAREIVLHKPDETCSSMEAAIAVRSYLMIRLALHTGVRQRNLRDLLLCPKSSRPTPASRLAEQRKGEIRWDDQKKAWEVFIPAMAFKNYASSFFNGKPFNLCLPNLDGLYSFLDEYVDRHRVVLLGSSPDPGAFFVTSSRMSNTAKAFSLYTFYSTYRAIIQRYGIFNPYTKRGAILGLLPHGPHVVRDIIATHILKKTGSAELAGFAIQDTPAAASRHYARFFPHEKAAKAAQILNKAWR